MSLSSKDVQQDLIAATTIQKQKPKLKKTSGSSRSEKLKQILEKCLSETIKNFNYKKVAQCFPTLAKNKFNRLKAAHSQVIEFLRTLSEKEINSILENHNVLKKLDELDEMINESKESNIFQHNSFPYNGEITIPTSSVRAKTLSTKQEELRRLENEFLKINNENDSLSLEIDSIQEQSQLKLSTLKNLMEPFNQLEEMEKGMEEINLIIDTFIKSIQNDK